MSDPLITEESFIGAAGAVCIAGATTGPGDTIVCPSAWILAGTAVTCIYVCAPAIEALQDIDIPCLNPFGGCGSDSNTLYSEDRNPAQDRRLGQGEIKKMNDLGIGPHELKEGTGTDIFVGEDGKLYEKPLDGSGPGDFTGIKIKQGKFYYDSPLVDIEVPGQ